MIIIKSLSRCNFATFGNICLPSQLSLSACSIRRKQRSSQESSSTPSAFPPTLPSVRRHLTSPRTAPLRLECLFSVRKYLPTQLNVSHRRPMGKPRQTNSSNQAMAIIHSSHRDCQSTSQTVTGQRSIFDSSFILVTVKGLIGGMAFYAPRNRESFATSILLLLHDAQGK